MNGVKYSANADSVLFLLRRTKKERELPEMAAKRLQAAGLHSLTAACVKLTALLSRCSTLVFGGIHSVNKGFCLFLLLYHELNAP